MAKQKQPKKANGGKRRIEQYDHKDKTRANNPPVGLVTPKTDPDLGRKTYQYDPHLDPQLQWSGKAERLSFEVPTVSLHVHERIDPKTIIRAVQKRNGDGNGKRRPVQGSLFEEPEENPPLREAVDFYKHAHGWSNRLIAGDSLVVMNSLLEKEGMAGKVQMVYIDPPYGIKYGSNFQPFVNKRDVKDGSDGDLTQEPEMIRAFRDTWELGIHSYLGYLRDRLVLTRDLLHESGSCFVQISDENVHHVREVMDEVFGAENCLNIIPFVKTSGVTTKFLASNVDFLVWYSRDKKIAKYRSLFLEKSVEAGTADNYGWIELPDGTRRGLNSKEKKDRSRIPAGARIYKPDNITSQGNPEFSFEYSGKIYRQAWKTNLEGMKALAAANRLHIAKNSLQYVRYLDDFPCVPITQLWEDTGTGSFTDEKTYVVQTGNKVIARCLLMTTDTGDLVFDATCGSGTTAYVAEQWGRRWITCDTSRVATTLAKQRLMTALFDYYELAHPEEGVGSGFKYKRVPHIMLKSIANNEPPGDETLYDQPWVDKNRVRVTGPFTLEAVPAPAVRPVTEVVIDKKAMPLDDQPTLPGVGELDGQPKLQFTEDVSVARFGETHRQKQWRDELSAAGIRGKGGQRVEFSRLEPLGGTKWLQCEGEIKPCGAGVPPAPKGKKAAGTAAPQSPHPNPLPEGEGTRNNAPLPQEGEGTRTALPEGEGRQRVVVSFGPEYAPLEQRQVEMALEEAVQLKPTPQVVVFAAFQFDPEAAKDIDETKWPGVTLLKVQMNTDLLTDDLKKNRSSNESYWLMGQPDVELRPIKKGDHKGKYEIEVHGFDYYNTRTGSIESGDTTKIAMWMLDTDYDGRSLFPRQVFFPMAGPKDGWARLAKNLKAEIDEDLIESYRGTVSLPFEPGDFKRAAVKIVDDRGIESLKIVEIG